eukprot:301233_1
MDGVYKWLYYDSFTNSSTYYNKHKNIHIYPQITSFGDKEYIIYSNQILAKCNISNIFEITYCIGHWNIFNYTGNEWNIYKDTNMITTACSDVCVHTNYDNNGDSVAIGSYGLFYWIDYDLHHRTSIYHCRQCVFEVYLLGHRGTVDGHTGWFWLTSASLMEPAGNMLDYCYLGNKLDNEYIFNLNDCSSAGSWTKDTKMRMKQCSANCIKLERSQFIAQHFNIDAHYYHLQNVAIRFDVNMDYNTDSLKIVCVCNFVEDVSYGTAYLTPEIKYDGPVIDASYNLLSHCNNETHIYIRIGFWGDDDNASSVAYVNNVYLYYNSNNDTLFFDNMDKNNWITSQTAFLNSSMHCKSDGKCYVMVASKNEYVYISKMISVNEYRYLDLNLEWSLITNGLTDNTTLNVSIYCDYNLHILKQYNVSEDCAATNNSCYIQSHDLPSKCDFASDIIIRFEMLSSSSTNIVYIDYVHLTHSKLAPFYIDYVPPLQTTLPYLYHDRFYSLSNWISNGNVSIDSSSHCPSTLNNNTKSFETNKISIGPNWYWYGVYEFKYYDKDVNGIIYTNTHKDQTSKLIYQYIHEDSTYTYYLTSRHMHQKEFYNLDSRKCTNVTDIRDCIGKWKYYDNNEWNIDENITSISANDI